MWEASWRAIGFCNGAPAAASHFLPRFGDPRPISTLASAMPSGSWRGAASRSWGRSRATGSSTYRASGTRLEGALASTRAAVRRAVASSVGPWSARSAAVVSAILIGDRAGLDADVERRLQEAGTYHVIAISGGNIAILAGLCIFLLRPFRVGPRSSALLRHRHADGVCLRGGRRIVGRPRHAHGRDLFRALSSAITGRFRPTSAALTAAILFCADPLQVVDAGFALTFGATLGILVGMSTVAADCPCRRGFAHRRRSLLRRRARKSRSCRSSAFVFSRVTFAGLIVNVAAIPLMTLVQIAGMAVVGLTWLAPELARWAGWIAHAAVEGLIGSAALVDVLPWLTRRLAPPSLWVVAVYYASLIGVVWGPFARLALSTLVAAGLWIVATPTLPTWSEPPLRVTFLDVGQGDAAIVQFPDGRTLSIDAGGLPSTTFDIGARVIAPAFWALGVRRLDYMSVTHGDVDHIGGAASVFRDFKPFEVWEGVPVPPHAPTRELRALADGAGTVWRTLQPADRVSFGDVDLVVHHPPRPEWERQRVRNDDSEVLEIRYGGVSFVFTGDIGRDVERTIAPYVRARARFAFSKCPTTAARPRARKRFSTHSGPTSPSSAPDAETHSAIRCRACWSGTGTSARQFIAPIRTGP